MAISGTPLSVARTSDTRAFVDGSSLRLPRLDDRDLLCSVCVQASLLAVGSFAPDLCRALRRARPAVADRYLVLEAVRAARQPGVMPEVAASRVLELGTGPLTARPEASLEVARSRVPVASPPIWMGTIRPRALLGGRDSAPAGSGAGCEPARRRLAPEPAGPGEDDAEADAETSRLLRLLASPIGSALLSRTLAKLLGSGGARHTEGGGGGEEIGVAGARAVRGGSAWRRLADTAAPGVAAVRPGGVAELYPEWDWQLARERPDWCAVHSVDPPARPDAEGVASHPDIRLRRELARIATVPRRRRNLPDGDAVDHSALVDYEVQRRIGDTTDPMVFESRRLTGRDLGVLVLLDATGSTAESPGARRLFDEQRRVAHRLTLALDHLGDRVASFGFYSRGRGNVRFLRIKDFDARYDRAAQKRLAALEPAGFTRLGAAVRHGTRLLVTAAGTSHLLLVVIGDGLPYDEDGYEERYAREDTGAALRSAVAAGVGCICVSVGPSTAATPPDLGHEVVHVHVEVDGDLDRSVRSAFRSALRSAAAPNRGHSHRRTTAADPMTGDHR